MIIKRKIREVLTRFLVNKEEFNNVLLIEGARQVGKTTLVRDVLNDLNLFYKEINLEEDTVFCEKIDRCPTFDQFTELIQTELKFQFGSQEILFIDEAQESRILGRFVRFMKEKWSRTQVILSGSSMSRIFRDDVRYPVGRVTSISVTPFSFEEFLQTGNEQVLLDQINTFIPHHPNIHQNHHRFLELFQQYMAIGGLPEVVTSFFNKGDWKRVRQNILLGYYSDFKRVFGEEKQVYFIAALKATACLLGTPFKNSFISQLMDGGKNQQIIETLGQLEGWKIILKVDQRGPHVETHYHPKRYLFDVGIAKELREEAMADIHLLHTLESFKRTPLGGLLENSMAHLLFGKLTELTGWKKSTSGSEIDFLLKRNGKIIPIECKSASLIKNSHLGGVRDFMKIYKTKIGVAVSLAPFEVRKIPEGLLLVIPFYLAERLEEVIEKM